MVTSGYDNKIKIWSACHQTQTSVLLRTLTGHENKVTSVCFTRDLQYLMTTSFDRTFKLWNMQQPQVVQEQQNEVGTQVKATEDQDMQ